MKSVRFVMFLALLLVGAVIMAGCGRKSVDDSLDAARDAITNKDHNAAAEHVARAIAKNPNDPVTRYRVVLIYSRPNFHDEQVQAARELQKLLMSDVSWPEKVDPSMMEAYGAVAILMDSGEEYELARWFYEQIVQHHPDNPTAANNLAYFYAEQNIELAKAEELASFALRKMPKSAFINDTMGWVCFKLNRMDEAEKYVANSIRTDPDSHETRYHLAAIQLALGKKEQARVELSKALILKPGYKKAEEMLRSLDQ